MAPPPPPPPPPSSLSFSVRRCKPELLTPAKPTPRELKQLSDIDDQQGHRCHIRILMFYKNFKTTSRIKETEHHRHHHVDPVSVIREAMAKALVLYYPLAGRLIEEPNKELTMDCTGQGILLVEADANVSLDQLGDFFRPPCPFAKEFLYNVPGSGGITECPLLLVQITRLSCGGFVLAIRLNHAVSDELGLVQFLKATADMAKGSSSSPPRPVWQRELLNAREPPQITCALHQYKDLGNHQSTTSMDMSDNNDTLHQSFFFGTKQMTAIFNHLPPPHLLHSSSTLQVLTAFLWRCRTIALQIDPNEIVRVTFMVDVRGKPGLNLPPGYYGNSSVSTAAISNAKMLCKNPLEYAVELVKKAEAPLTEKYIRSVADFLVVKGRPPYSRSWNFIVSDTTRAGLGEVDFGWGKPVYGGPIGGTSFSSPYALFRNGDGEDGIVVPICLPVAAMERFKVELWRMTLGTNGDSHVGEPIKITSML